MMYVDWGNINSLAVAKLNTPAVYVTNGLNYDESDDHIWQFVMDQVRLLYPDPLIVCGDLIHGGLFVFDSISDRDVFYNIFTQELTESSAIYVCMYDADGTCITENT
jgi:hypothetical protein